MFSTGSFFANKFQNKWDLWKGHSKCTARVRLCSIERRLYPSIKQPLITRSPRLIITRVALDGKYQFDTHRDYYQRKTRLANTEGSDNKRKCFLLHAARNINKNEMWLYQNVMACFSVMGILQVLSLLAICSVGVLCSKLSFFELNSDFWEGVVRFPSSFLGPKLLQLTSCVSILWTPALLSPEKNHEHSSGNVGNLVHMAMGCPIKLAIKNFQIPCNLLSIEQWHINKLKCIPSLQVSRTRVCALWVLFLWRGKERVVV